MKLKELIFRSLGYKLQNYSAGFKSFDIKKEYGPLIIRKGTSDIRVFKQIFLDEVYFFFPNNFIPKTIVDAGANVGYSAVWFASKFPSAKIIAIEPEQSNFEVLVQNSGSRENIKPINAGLWNEKSFLKINNPSADSWAFKTTLAEKGEAIGVETVTIPELIDHFNLNQIDLLKIDIEGAEYELFEKGASEWLPKVKMIMIEIHDQMRPGCSDLIDKTVMPFGFTKFITKELTVFYKS